MYVIRFPPFIFFVSSMELGKSKSLGYNLVSAFLSLFLSPKFKIFNFGIYYGNNSELSCIFEIFFSYSLFQSSFHILKS